MKDKHNSLVILKSTLSRLPSYYCFVEERKAAGEEYVSSVAMAESLGINPVLVRKDLASISREPGRPKVGFRVETLLADMKKYLGYDHYDEAVLVGVGALGHVLLQYGGFGRPVLPVEKLVSFLRRTHIGIGIIAVPAREAQKVAQMLIDGGVRAIWNFAPTTLELPREILVKNENLAASLAALTTELRRRIGGGGVDEPSAEDKKTIKKY